MKIAILSFYSGTVPRGVETFVHELSNRLTEKGMDITVYQNGPRLPGTKYKVVSVQIPVDWGRSMGHLLLTTAYFTWRVKHFTHKVLGLLDKDVDIVFPTNGQWQGALCSVWAKKHRKKMVISGQSGPGLDDRINLYGFPDVFVALTDFQKQWAKKINPRVRVEKIPNGVDIERFNPKVKPYDFNLPRPIILCAAALDFWKRQNLAIEAVSKLSKGSLVLVGSGPQEKNLQKLGKKLLPGRFKILNFTHEEMPKVYTGADLFTFPTVTYESFGIVLLEAMASGLPVVTTEDPIRKEIAGDAGIFVDPRDPDEYEKALQKAMETNWGNKPRAQAEKFSWDMIADKYETLFKTLV